MSLSSSNQTSHSFLADNPCYFCNDTKSPRTPDSQSSGKRFSIFTRRNSKGSSPRPLNSNPEQTRLITSANLDTTATMAFGSPRGSFNSLGGFSQVRISHPHKTRIYHIRSGELPVSLITPPASALPNVLHLSPSQHSFELQPLMYHQRSSNSHSESFRERLGSCNETHSSQCPGGGAEHDDVFNAR